MTSSRLPARTAWAMPLVLCVPLLMGADGGGCEGGPFAAGDGGVVPEDGSTVCTPASCAGLGAPALAKLCPDGTTLSETVCEDEGDGRCGWGFAPCPTDGGSTADAAVDTCPPAPVCNLPDCMYGVLPQTDANGCPACGICAPAPDAGSDAGCDCGPPPPVAACPGGGSLSVTCETNASGSCSWLVGSCTTDAGGGPCTLDVECPKGQVCGFPEAAGCGVEGTCFVAQQVICNAYSPGCACDGSEISVACTGLPSGYVSKPLRHTGACVDGG
jgi:hypothetical protein